MSIVYKILLGITSLAILVFLVFFTFFDQTSVNGVNQMDTLYQVGKYTITSQEDDVKIEKFSEAQIGSGSIIYEKLNAFDEIFLTQESQYEYQKDATGSLVNISKGDFIFSRYDIFTPLEYRSNNFSVFPHGVGKIYIQTSTQKQILFALDGIFTITLKSTDGSPVTSLVLYPHQYFIFSPTDLIYVFHADHLRLKSVFDFQYFSRPISDLNDAKDSRLIQLGLDTDFIKKAYAYFGSRELAYTQEMKKLRARMRIDDIPGMSYIQKYTYFFVNDAKKQVYSKNILLSLLESMIKQNDTDELHKLQQDFLSQLSTISFTQQDKEQILGILNDTYTKLLYISDDAFLPQKKLFSDLYQAVNKLDISKIGDVRGYVFLINNLYVYYDQNRSAGFYIRFVSFLNQYLKSLGISSQQLPEEEKHYTLHDLEYLSFFLESILVSNLVENTNILPSLNQILQKYNLLNTLVYSQVDSTVKTTGLYINLELLRNIGTYVADTYFSSQRSANQLLEKKGGISDVEAVRNLQANFEEIKKFYDANSQFLSDADSRDVELKNHYDTIFRDYQEYFLALLDYDNYLLNFDPVSRALKDKIGYIGELQTTNDTLSESSIRQYLSQFKGLEISQMEVQIVDNNLYNIQNVYLNGQKIAFSIYPFSGYELTDIVIQDEPRRESYKLENIKDDWSEKVSGSANGDEYDFSQFFLLKFIKKDIQVLPIQDIETSENVYQCPEETKVVRAFKIQLFDKNKGPFIPLRNVLTIDYKNLCVTGDTADNFQMQLQGPVVQISAAGQLQGILEGKYTLEQNVSKFEDLKIYPYVITPNDGKKIYKWQKTPIIVRGFITLNEFENNITALGEMIGDVDAIIQSLGDLSGIQNIEINYFVARKRMVIKFDFKANKANIGLDAKGVDSFIYSNKNILTEKTPISGVIDLIKNLK